MANKFQLDTDDVLGFNYQAYVAEIRSLALSKPAEYFLLRKEVLKKVKTDAVGDVYKTLFSVLSQGKDKDNHPIGKLGTGSYIPAYPSQKINDFAIQVASDMADHINRAIDIILPDDFEKLASGKLNLKGRANVIEDPPRPFQPFQG
jgi:hypothetical protein